MNYWIEWYQGLDYFSVEINVIKLIEMGTTALQLFVQWKHIKATATSQYVEQKSNEHQKNMRNTIIELK